MNNPLKRPDLVHRLEEAGKPVPKLPGYPHDLLIEAANEIKDLRTTIGLILKKITKSCTEMVEMADNAIHSMPFLAGPTKGLKWLMVRTAQVAAQSFPAPVTGNCPPSVAITCSSGLMTSGGKWLVPPIMWTTSSNTLSADLIRRESSAAAAALTS